MKILPDLKVMICFLWILGVVMIPLSAYAQSDNNNTKLTRFITLDTSYVEELTKQAQNLFLISLPSCTITPTIKRLKPTIIEPARFANNNDKKTISKPGHGQWIERIQLTACNQTIQHNFLATASNTAEIPLLLPLLNGQSRIQPIDQKRAEEKIKQTVKNSGCSQSPFVLGANFIGYKAKGSVALSKTNQNAGWFEEWVIDACDKQHIVNMAILPDKENRIRFIARVRNDNKTEDSTKPQT